MSQIAKAMGFEKCEWGPDPDDTCESCKKGSVQLYYSGGEDGSHWCLDCIVEMHKENESASRRIEDLEKQGHPPHCAARQVWGDGECECDLYKKGYDPYAWIKHNRPACENTECAKHNHSYDLNCTSWGEGDISPYQCPRHQGGGESQ